MKTKNSVLQKSLSPQKTLNSKRKEETISNTINSSSVNNKNKIKRIFTGVYNSNKVKKNNSTEKLVKASVSTGNKFPKQTNNDKYSRNKSPAMNRISANETNNDVMKRENFKFKNKLFSSCSNIRSSNGKLLN
jgi:hypothetical protein